MLPDIYIYKSLSCTVSKTEFEQYWLLKHCVANELVGVTCMAGLLITLVTQGPQKPIGSLHVNWFW